MTHHEEPPRSVSCNLCATTFRTDVAKTVVKDGYTIVRCPECGLVCRASLPVPAEIERLYGAEYFASAAGDLGHEGYLDYVADEAVHRTNARRRLALLGRHVPQGQLLDVGCAAGFFVDEAARAGWSAQGVDISASMIAWGKERLSASLSTGTIAAARAATPMDCVTMWDYIEHSLDPHADLVQAHDALRPGGILALSTGDVGAVIARLALRRWHLLTPRHHNYFFSALTMRRMLEQCGFETVYLGHPASMFPLKYLAHKAALVVDRAPVRAAARSLARTRVGGWVVPASLWDVMTVVARVR